MASVERRYNKAGNLISIRVHVFHGRDEFGNQLPPFIKTFRIPPGLNARQIETFIQRETVHFEEECELIKAREKEEAAKAAEPKCISFEDFAAKIMEIKERTGIEKSTLARYQDMLDSRINPYLGKVPVDEITGDMLDDFYAMLLKPGQNKKTGGGLSRKTVLEHHHVISTVMEHAMDEILHRYLKWRYEQPELYGDLWHESGYLFTNEYGGPMNPDTITQHLNRMGDRLQKQNPNFPHLNPHAFRHAVASILVANGTDIVTTAAFIGDKPATVSERYAHIIDSAKIKAGNTLSNVIFGDGER